MFTPEWSYELLRPAEQMEIDLVGSAVEGGRGLSGIGGAINTSGGGFWQVKLAVDLFEKAEHRFWNKLSGILSGGVRSVIVPFLTDWTGPFDADAVGEPIVEITGIPHDDGSFFSDGSGYEQSAVPAVIVGPWAVNAGTISLQVFGGQELAGGEIFSIEHPTKGFRAYRIGEIDSVDTTTDPNSITYSVAIRPTLREAVLGGEDAAFDRPRCLMKLPAGATMPWSVSGYWRTQQNVTLVEAF